MIRSLPIFYGTFTVHMECFGGMVIALGCTADEFPYGESVDYVDEICLQCKFECLEVIK